MMLVSEVCVMRGCLSSGRRNDCDWVVPTYRTVGKMLRSLLVVVVNPDVSYGFSFNISISVIKSCDGSDQVC